MQELRRAGNQFEPKYKQLAELLIAQIENGYYDLNEQIPSIKQLAQKYNISRETVSKALKLLSEQGIIRAVYRQGYFVQTTDIKVGLRIFFLMDKMTAFKNRMYEAFMKTIGNDGEVQIFFHHHNYEVFKSLILNNLNNYTHYVIVTYLKERVDDLLNQIPPEKRLILDNYEGNLHGQYPMVYQNFEADIYNCLIEAYPKLKKYHRLVLVGAHSRWGSDRVLKGFIRFCKEHEFSIDMADEVQTKMMQKGSVYIFLSRSDQKLVEAIKLCRDLNYKIGTDIGMISYNDTYTNEVLAGGISVINTDFITMGKTAAELILRGEALTVVNPSKLILRNSL